MYGIVILKKRVIGIFAVWYSNQLWRRIADFVLADTNTNPPENIVKRQQTIFSKKTRSALKKAGWYQERYAVFNNDIRLLEKYLKAPLFPTAYHFLACYGRLGLTENFWSPQEIARFDVRNADQHYDIDADGLSGCSQIINARFCAIGTANHDHVLLLMDEQGGSYGYDGGALYFIGYSGEEAIENLCLNKKPLWIKDDKS